MAKQQEQQDEENQENHESSYSDSNEMSGADIFIESESNKVVLKSHSESPLPQKEGCSQPKKVAHRPKDRRKTVKEPKRSKRIRKREVKKEIQDVDQRVSNGESRDCFKFNQDHDWNRVGIDQYPDYEGPDTPDCHFKMDPDLKTLYCRFCNEEFTFSPMSSARMNQHMLTSHREHFKQRDIFSNEESRKEEAESRFFYPKFAKINSKRSLVWGLFMCNTQINFVICTRCWMTYNVRDGSTSGMLKHLEKSHAELLRELRGKEAEKSSRGNETRRRRRNPRTRILKTEQQDEQVEQAQQKPQFRVGEIYGWTQFAYRDSIYSQLGFC